MIPGNGYEVLLLTVPLAVLAVFGLLALASMLERRRVEVLVRLTVRSKTDPDEVEVIVASELGPLLAAKGLASPRRSAPA